MNDKFISVPGCVHSFLGSMAFLMVSCVAPPRIIYKAAPAGIDEPDLTLKAIPFYEDIQPEATEVVDSGYPEYAPKKSELPRPALPVYQDVEVVETTEKSDLQLKIEDIVNEIDACNSSHSELSDALKNRIFNMQFKFRLKPTSTKNEFDCYSEMVKKYEEYRDREKIQ